MNGNETTLDLMHTHIIDICTTSWLYLAETRRSELAPEYREIAPTQGFPWWIVAAVLLGLLVVGGIYWVICQLRVPAIPIADDLTLELCRAHRIGLPHRVALDHVAKLAGMTQTAELFLSPTDFDAAVKKAERKRRLRGKQRESLYLVRRLIFSDIQPA
ncbi:hypothetical protein [Rhodopirellula sallentina]|uniref:Putative membrane protein n=1 Tax=Rhodopirellula sallentina SM41 TaxID=1263870 RepID=M5TUD4_9BACT|nr:hypothetical protein [Rhodopirellula sallentina]EMI52669.1 putative membrane protein [Rhodopirellula sallentina SM41]